MRRKNIGNAAASTGKTGTSCRHAVYIFLRDFNLCAVPYLFRPVFYEVISFSYNFLYTLRSVIPRNKSFSIRYIYITEKNFNAVFIKFRISKSSFLISSIYIEARSCIKTGKETLLFLNRRIQMSGEEIENTLLTAGPHWPDA